jgi:Peptidase family C25
MCGFIVFCRIFVLSVVFSLSVFSQSLDLKIAVEHDGFYRLSRAELAANGFSSTENPTKIQLFTDGTEQAIRINTDNSIDFFGKQTTSRWTAKKTYLLTHGENFGKRIGKTVAKFDGSIENTQISAEINHDEKHLRAIYIADGERDNFYSASLYYAAPYSQSVYLQHLTYNDAVLEIALQGYSNNAHNVSVLLNDTEIGVLNFNYPPRSVKQFAISNSLLNDGENTVKLVSGISSGTVLLEYVKLSYQKNAVAADDFLKFNLPANQPIYVGGFEKEKPNVLDITDANNVKEIAVQTNADREERYGFTLKPSSQNRVIWSQAENYESVAEIKTDTPSDLKSRENEADFIILTHADFRQALQPLADIREHEELKTRIIDVEDVYDEFNNGEKSPRAIKDFMKFASENWVTPPRYLLLVGDSSNDPKGYLPYSHEEFMPSYMADTVYFPMEASSDDSFTDFNNDAIADIPTGRLSVKTEIEAENIVDKILRYEQTINDKPRSALLVSDLPIDYNFSAMTDEVQLSMPPNMSKLKINRNDGTAEIIRQNILNRINQGYDFVNFLGHGNTANWTSAALLRSTDGATLTNQNRTSVFIMLACLNGSFAESDVSLAESLQKAPTGGAVAVWASSALTYAYGQVEMSKSFYRKTTAEPHIRIGNAIKYAKGTMQDKDVRRFAVLFGDPTMHVR